MDDREKVIKGLKCCSEIKEKCDDCPYSGVLRCMMVLKRDALELLKAQGPRVMTLEEVLNTDPDWVVCEFRYGMEVSRHSPKVVKYWANGVKYKYGQTWRCWTAWPTDEQRKAVKWDD